MPTPQDEFVKLYNDPNIKITGGQGDFISGFNNPNVTLEAPPPVPFVPQPTIPQRPIITPTRPIAPTTPSIQPFLEQKQQLQQNLQQQKQELLQKKQGLANQGEQLRNWARINWSGVPKGIKAPKVPLPAGGKEWVWNRGHWNFRL